MATRNMLIDASHPEETRVVVVEGNRVEDYDVEVAARRQLKGNIYLAKVTRVEPSLQAAFVDFGGNRHGFLAFNEIHPDYYQIPVADRERLLAEQAAESAERDDGDDGDALLGDEEEEGERRRVRPPTRYYKIQEVIKRRQIMLVQVAKEERGNKGAALTTYLSLAGRYCVLMPNTSRGGGISRKIAGPTDRKRLKKILAELDVHDGMAVIVRTAGAGRSKAEIKRDYEYLVRLWSSIRETTLRSTAPTLVYEEASLIKRSIRDLYGRDIEEIIVQGEDEYRTAKEFMKLFISSHAKRVKLYEDENMPLFQRFGVEEHLDSMHQPTVQLRSGGYIVINPTEALVAIDVNSGRSTRERNIEETALRTNLEAADEIARQLRLRDLAGLIVVDFIDMENPRNQGLVERRLKDAMKSDRARVQLGRISPFGLLELSRQRLRPSLIETSFEICPACGGNGLRRTTESTALAILRKLEEEGIKRRTSEVSVAIPPAVALYLLNQKRRSLLAIEERYQLAIGVIVDATLVPPEHRLERLKPLGARPVEEAADEEEVVEAEAEEAAEAPGASDREEAAGKRTRRRRPRRRRRGDEEVISPELRADAAEAEEPDEVEEAAEEGGEAGDAAVDATEQQARKRRRRGKRGGRRRTRPAPDAPAEAETMDAEPVQTETVRTEVTDDGQALVAGAAESADAPAMVSRDDEDGPVADHEPVEAEPVAELLDDAGDEAGSTDSRPRRRGVRRSRVRATEEDVAPASEDEAAAAPAGAEFIEMPDVDISIVGGARPLLEEKADEVAAEHAQSAEGAREQPALQEPTTGEGEVPATVEPAAEEEPVAAGVSSGPGGGREIADRDNLAAAPEEHPTPQEIAEQHPAPVWEQPMAPAAAEPGERDRFAQALGTATESPGAGGEATDDAGEQVRRTQVIRVGEGEDDSRDEGPRRGWWQRLLT